MTKDEEHKVTVHQETWKWGGTGHLFSICTCGEWQAAVGPLPISEMGKAKTVLKRWGKVHAEFGWGKVQRPPE